MYRLGLSDDNLTDIKLELDRNGRSVQRSRNVSVNYKGHTRIQVGMSFRTWSGSIAFDTEAERDFLRDAYRQRTIWLEDNTPNGAGVPVKVFWHPPVNIEYDEPTVDSGRFIFHFEAVEGEPAIDG